MEGNDSKGECVPLVLLPALRSLSMFNLKKKKQLHIKAKNVLSERNMRGDI